MHKVSVIPHLQVQNHLPIRQIHFYIRCHKEHASACFSALFAVEGKRSPVWTNLRVCPLKATYKFCSPVPKIRQNLLSSRTPSQNSFFANQIISSSSLLVLSDADFRKPRGFCIKNLCLVQLVITSFV